jgi:hypothetical protein
MLFILIENILIDNINIFFYLYFNFIYILIL